MGDYDDAMMRNQNAAVQARTKAQNRANVMQLKLIGQSHPTGLTANLLKLFEPRPPLEYKPPPEKSKCPPYSGIAQFVGNFAEPGDPEYAPPMQKCETPGGRSLIHSQMTVAVEIFSSVSSPVVFERVKMQKEEPGFTKYDWRKELKRQSRSLRNMMQIVTQKFLEILTKHYLWLGLIMRQLRAESKGSLRLMVLSSG